MLPPFHIRRFRKCQTADLNPDTRNLYLCLVFADAECMDAPWDVGPYAHELLRRLSVGVSVLAVAQDRDTVTH